MAESTSKLITPSGKMQDKPSYRRFKGEFQFQRNPEEEDDYEAHNNLLKDHIDDYDFYDFDDSDDDDEYNDIKKEVSEKKDGDLTEDIKNIKVNDLSEDGNDNKTSEDDDVTTSDDDDDDVGLKEQYGFNIEDFDFYEDVNDNEKKERENKIILLK